MVPILEQGGERLLAQSAKRMAQSEAPPVPFEERYAGKPHNRFVRSIGLIGLIG